ncbi:probable enoyl-CoA hydratase echA8 isoform X1 [Chelmon rostratus]|uniref:probable enoyl-CoA hydratase echA8 isoform X1 n=1 Tax=Chelmon rostratus TaxID=109905 RepID=UPI001BE94A13|nr:probable enoyl-CoA hydratase echA8 isoform X1 [Chelmon rostratus]
MHPVALFCLLLSWMQSPLAAVDSWIPWDDPNNVRSTACCNLKPQSLAHTHTYKHTLRQSESQGPHLSPRHLFHCFAVCHCFCYQVCPHKTIYIPSPSLLLWGFNLMSLSGPLSKCCGPCWFLSVHLDHPLSLAAGQTVVTVRRGSVVTVGINRPEVRNAVNQETARRLLEDLEAFDSDPDLNVAVLHGKGGNFCAGYDLKELANHTASLKLEQDVTKGPGPLGPSRLELSKPLIAAVSGFAVAGGLELALLADLRVVEESAIMGVFCRRFGVPLIDGGTVRLPRLIGLSRALDLILTGRPIGAQEALAYGLANRVVPDGQALQEALQLAEQISSFPQQCLRADRSSAMHSCYDAPSFTQAMQYEVDYGLPVIQSESVAGATRFTTGAGRGGKFS